uniref:Glutamate receptor n=1 Tax=Kalanchoe fedtschenkoi TaxID=63787 RepID=A0A7N0TCU7_KALFE
MFDRKILNGGRQTTSSSGCLFSMSLIWFCVLSVMADDTANVTVNVGVVLDLTKISENSSFLSISLALKDFYNANHGYHTRIVLHARDSQLDVVAATAAAVDLIKNGKVKAIIGPSTSRQANFMINLGDKAQVPIITYYATSPLLSSIRNPYFFRATHNDSTQVQAISALVKNFHWREVVIIHGENEFGEGVVPFLTDALQDVNCRVPYRSIIPLNATDAEIKAELYKVINTGIRVFVVHMVDDLAVRVFQHAKEVSMIKKDYSWIVTNEIGNRLDSKNPEVLKSMQGILGIKNYIPSSEELSSFKLRWLRNFRLKNPNYNQNVELDTFGIWAHDAAVALAMAVEKVFGSGKEYDFSYPTGNSTDIEMLGVSNAGPELRVALSNISFRGFAGNFSFVDGEILPTAFEIVNVVGNGQRGVGFWTPDGGLSRDLSSEKTGTGSSKSNLGVIFWPGEGTSPPKGWALPIEGKKLRVGVPAKDGFFEFVKVTRDPDTKSVRKVTGYCIDVFEAVMEAMPYAIPYEYIPFALPNGSSYGSYNDLTYQVALGHFDAVVGDVTIVANRTSYIDYTLPFTESGVSLMVPLNDPIKRSSWIFLKPLTLGLWLATLGVFLLIAVSVLLLERETEHDEFRKGSLFYRICTALWFSFSIMVFAQKEKTENNLTRFLLVLWFFVVLILTQTYTASLTSMLTVQRLQPALSDIKYLVEGGHSVGYQTGSYVLALLKEMGFDETRLKTYDSVDTLYAALVNGSSNGGISAAFDEIPYLQVFRGQHCSEYAMVGPKYKTAGFGFVSLSLTVSKYFSKYPF